MQVGIRKFTISGNVKNYPNRVIHSSVSAPHGMLVAKMGERLEAFRKAFENVTIDFTFGYVLQVPVAQG